jgi:phage terminase small subunit
MPRRSPEARAAAYYRTGGKSPPAPDHLSPKAKRVWREITASRPPDFFTRGSWPLLAQYCELDVLQQGYLTMLRDDPLNPEVQAVTIKMAASLCQLATKLRLAITSVDKRSGLLTEKGDPEPRQGDDTLFGGNVVRF